MDYNKSDQYYSKLSCSTLCACLGKAVGEPLCPCQMARQELPMSLENVQLQEATEKNWAAFFLSNGFKSLK